MKQKISHYAAQDIESTWDPRRCIHTAECIHSLPEVFDTERRPWIDPGETTRSLAPGTPRRFDIGGRRSCH